MSHINSIAEFGQKVLDLQEGNLATINYITHTRTSMANGRGSKEMWDKMITHSENMLHTSNEIQYYINNTLLGIYHVLPGKDQLYIDNIVDIFENLTKNLVFVKEM